jgi:hypothetical protein
MWNDLKYRREERPHKREAHVKQEQPDPPKRAYGKRILKLGNRPILQSAPCHSQMSREVHIQILRAPDSVAPSCR